MNEIVSLFLQVLANTFGLLVLPLENGVVVTNV